MDDTNDPRWSSTFWAEGSEWLIPGVVRRPNLADAAGSRYLSLEYNMYEEKAPGVTGRYNNRWDTLSQFHGVNRRGNTPLYPLQNAVPGLRFQPVLAGYDVQMSVQTIGDHDNEVHWYPDYELWGNFCFCQVKNQPSY